MLVTVAIENYRSLRHLVIPLQQLSVITGSNGTGKSSLYRALRLLADSARNGAVAALAREGGLPSTLWAGPEDVSASVRRGEHAVQGTRRRRPVALRMGFATDEYGYAVDFGLPTPGPSSMFDLDPEIKSELIWSGPVLRPVASLAERRGDVVRIRDRDHQWRNVRHQLRPYDSMLSELADPETGPELIVLRDRIRSWRFYDHFRTDSDSSARRRQVGTRTPVLGHDGADLAASLQTIREIGDGAELDATIEHAFPGSRIEVVSSDGWFEVLMRQHGLLRPLGTAELSDGTLRYLMWVAALLTPRPPELLIINEPETSLHPDLIAPLANLIAAAASRSQVIVVTHAAPLVSALTASAAVIELTKNHGMTEVVGQGLLDRPVWQWAHR